MPKVQCNVSVDLELKTAAQKELRRLGMSLSDFMEGCFLALLEGKINDRSADAREKLFS